jgi:hypothetical protein
MLLETLNMEKTQAGVLKQQLDESCMQLMKLLEGTKSYSQAEEKLEQLCYHNSATALKAVLRKAAESLDEVTWESRSKYESAVASSWHG